MGLIANGMPIMGADRADRQHRDIMSLAQLYLPPSSTFTQANGQNLLEDSLEHEHHVTEEDAVMQEWQRIRMARVQCGCCDELSINELPDYT